MSMKVDNQPLGPHRPQPGRGVAAHRTADRTGLGIVALDAGIDTSIANPAARLQIAMMLAFSEWERQTVRERSIAGQLRAREAGKSIGRPEALTESAKFDIRLLHQQGRSATRLAEDSRVARSSIYKAIAAGETCQCLGD